MLSAGMLQFQGFRQLSLALQKLSALVFLVAIALVPIAIVVLAPSGGGIWVAGYVTGMITAPIVAIGALRAISALNETVDLNVALVFVAFGVLVTLVSVAAALWSFLS